MATKAKAAESSEITIMEVKRGRIEVCILGTSPLIMNRMSQKAWHELMAPQGRKNSAVKQATLKHEPIAEFRASPYRLPTTAKRPTVLAILPTMFKGAMRTAALDLPDTKKAQIGRLVSVDWDRVPLYGIPRVFMAITRSADMNKTPDVRTRALLPEWACRLTVEFVEPILRKQSIANLLATSGITSGVCDWRQEKGSGAYGAFQLVSADDPDFVRITTTQGRAAQQDALDFPQAYDEETAEMLAWFDVEIQRRGHKLYRGPDITTVEIPEPSEVARELPGTKKRAQPQRARPTRKKAAGPCAFVWPKSRWPTAAASRLTLFWRTRRIQTAHCTAISSGTTARPRISIGSARPES